MKRIILTIDYELFLGDSTGSVEKCMVEPTYKLSEILDINNSKMTVFWDILHYYRLFELENDFTEIKDERRIIDEQISFLVSGGHDIQLHIHPHWLDAVYQSGKWKFNYEHFNIHSLSEEDNPDKINTIPGCITQSRKLMEKEIRKYLSDYKVTTYRAGGYLIEPFIKLKKALEHNNIFIDSSVISGLMNNNPANAYDFRNYPDNNFYNFENSPLESFKDGRFIEFPIATIKIPVIKNLIFTILRKLKYSSLERGRLGTGSSETKYKGNNSTFVKIISLLTKSKVAALTTDGNFSGRFNYMCNKVKDNSTMILHPKLLNSHTISLLKEKLLNNEIKFVSIKNYLNGEK
jgi:hypothetical protein